MDTKKLRQKILDLAIRGKLVPQDPNDEPASVLLEHIREEKERLIKEGKIKRSKTSAANNGIEPPFEIPESWEWTRLNEITELIEDCPHSTAKDEGVGYALIRTPNVGEGHLILDGVHRVSETVYNKRNARAIPEATDIIYAREAPAGNAAVVGDKERVCLGQRTVLIRPVGEFVNSQLLAYFILSPSSRNRLVSTAVGSTAAHVNLESIRPFSVPLPPFAEQQRIANEIERWFAAIDELESNEADLQKTIDKAKSKILDLAIHGKLVPQDPNDEPASLLLEQIREEKNRLANEGKLQKKDLEEKTIDEDEIPFYIPDSWEWVRIGSIFNHSSGKQLNASDTEGSLLEYITTSNLYWGRFELNNLKSMYYKDSEVDKCTAKQGDLLVCEGGDIGRSAIWPYDYDICLQNHIHRLRSYVSGNAEFAYYIMWNYKNSGQIGGKGIAIQGLSASALKSIIIPLPPLAEQKRIVAKIEELFAVLDSISAS